MALIAAVLRAASDRATTTNGTGTADRRGGTIDRCRRGMAAHLRGTPDPDTMGVAVLRMPLKPAISRDDFSAWGPA